MEKTTIVLNAYSYFEEGNFTEKGFYDLNAVTWWTLKKAGITLYGPEVQTLGINVGKEDLMKAMRYNLDIYWTGKAQNGWLFMDEEWIEFSVLSICRIYYTVITGEITSKSEAGRYVFNRVSTRWQSVIKEALKIRKQISGEDYFTNPLMRAEETQAFLREMIKVSQMNLSK